MNEQHANPETFNPGIPEAIVFKLLTLFSK